MAEKSEGVAELPTPRKTHFPYFMKIHSKVLKK